MTEDRAYNMCFLQTKWYNKWCEGYEDRIGKDVGWVHSQTFRTPYHYSFIHSIIQSFTQSFTQSFNHSFNKSREGGVPSGQKSRRRTIIQEAGGAQYREGHHGLRDRDRDGLCRERG